MSEDIVSPERALTDEEREALIIDHVPLLKHIVGRMVLDVPGRWIATISSASGCSA